MEVCEEVTEGPAGVGRCRGRVQECDRALLRGDVREKSGVLFDGREFWLVRVVLPADEKESAGRGKKG